VSTAGRSGAVQHVLKRTNQQSMLDPPHWQRHCTITVVAVRALIVCLHVCGSSAVRQHAHACGACRAYNGYGNDHDIDEEGLLAEMEGRGGVNTQAGRGQATPAGAGGSQPAAQPGTQSGPAAVSGTTSQSQQQQQAGAGATTTGTASAPTVSQPTAAPSGSRSSNVSWIGIRMPETSQEHCELASGSWCGPYYDQVSQSQGKRDFTGCMDRGML
jgi:hypothetical protein